MDKMILKDNTTIELQTGASLSAVTAKFNSKDDMLVAWKTLTPENLAEVKFQNNAGMTVGTYKDLILESEASQEVSDGVQTTFSFRVKTTQRNAWMLWKRGRQCRTRRSATWGKPPANWQRKKV